MERIATIALLAAALAVAGCFEEPVPASKTVPEGARLYLQDKGLKDLASCRDSLKPEIVDYVNLDRNELSEFPAELASLTGLKWLRLNDNKLSSLPDLSALAGLRRIYLRGNKFESVPETLKSLESLTDIDLSENPVSEVPEWLAQKKGLENLSFSRTKVTALPQDISAWKSLRSLQLGDLQMSAEEMARIRAALPSTAVVF